MMRAETYICGYRNQKLEKCVRSRLRPHILNILGPEQFDFRKELPTENTAYRLKNIFFSDLSTTKGILEQFSTIWPRPLIK